MEIAMNISLRALVLGAMVLGPLKALAALPPTEIFKLAEPAVLILEVRDARGEWVLGASAIALEKGVAVTQCDLLPAGASFAVVQGQRRFAAYARERDEARNLCRLDVPGLRGARLEVVPLAEARVGQRVYAVGNALGMGLSISEGVASGLRDQGGETWIQTTAALAPGSEGGALLDDQGRLLGMTDYRKRDGQNINFAAPAAWLPEVARRAASADQALVEDARRTAECLRLAQAKDWSGLAAQAGEWSRARPEQADAWDWLGLAHEAGGAYAEAARAFEIALQRKPDSVTYALALARTQMHLKQADKALAVLRQAIARHQEEAALWFARMQAEAELGLAEDGLRSLEETLRLDPGHVGAWEARVGIARRANDAEGLRQATGNLTRIAPENTDYWVLLAQAHLAQGRPARALKAVERAEALLGEGAGEKESAAKGDVLVARGAVLATLGAYQQAIVTLRRALATQTRQRAYGLSVLGNAYYQAQVFPEAIQALREAVSLAPSQLNYQYALGLALKDGGRAKEALAIYAGLRDKAPQDASVWRQLGFVNAILGRNEEAVAAMEHSLGLAPEQAKLWSALGEVNVRLGRLEEARRVYQRLRSLDGTRAEQFYRGYLLAMEVQP